MTGEANFSNLELVARIDSWPYFQRDPDVYRKHMMSYYYFSITRFDKPFGYAHYSIIPKVSWEESWRIDKEHRLLIFEGGNNFDERCRRMEDTLRSNPKKDETSAFGGWCDELFPVYDANGEHILDLNGASVDALGIVNYACHLIADVITKDGLKDWVSRRAKTKRGFPDMLDNTVGGSLSSGEKPIDCIVRECAEEASLPTEYTKAKIIACGDVVPIPNDGGAQEFNLISLEEVVTALRKGEFKLNCAMTWMASLIRHGYVNAENESNLAEISSRLHRKHELFIA
ncbi:hypothetical protein FB567DRAFT_567718 [Paraphoma chrysanthemicola]|uniref:Nudix hydrolase domain-containing protein n=1 Tax=Paraphoma chrysanthemicola TaxID=798071 RepID=A0A8K0RCZ0_9PLEO|nr:hypothetical protein FB567DRAFT_567718 [Paraphoma chrysanthemicola]